MPYPGLRAAAYVHVYINGREKTDMRKIISVILSAVLVLMMCAPALADSVDKRVMLGADNGQAAIDKIYGYFRINRGDVMEIPVTNAEEREYLAGLVPDRKIGNVALSSAYIDTSTHNGLEIESFNIDWVTPEMYRNALATAGIENAKVIVAAANPVSGTGALAGIYKAYEDITGEELDSEAKDVAAEELVVTGDLQEQIGESASGIITDVKSKLDETRKMTDDEIRKMIEETAQKYSTVLNQEQIQQIFDLLKKMQGLNININIFEGIANGANGAEGGGGFWEAIGNFFKGIGDFFVNLFGGGNKDKAEETASSEPSADASAEGSATQAPAVSDSPESEAPSESPSAEESAAQSAAQSESPSESAQGSGEAEEALPSADPETENVVRTGKIVSVDAEENMITMSVRMPESDSVETVVGIVSDETIIADVNTGLPIALSDLKTADVPEVNADPVPLEDLDGDEATAYLGMQSTFSLPPQSPLAALLVGTRESSDGETVYVRPQSVTEGEAGSRILVSQNADLVITIPAGMEIRTADGGQATAADLTTNSRLVVGIGDMAMRSTLQIDAQWAVLYPDVPTQQGQVFSEAGSEEPAG